MYIYQNGKLYTQHGGSLVGVEIYSDKVITLDGTETKLSKDAKFLTPYEVQCKFGNEYKFPRKVEQIIVVEKPVEIKVEGVDDNVPINKSKVTTPKRRTKSTK